MNQKDLYLQLAESIGAEDSMYIPKIFEALVDEKEASVLLAASPPADLDEIAARSGLSSKEVEELVDPLFRKGLLFKSRKPEGLRYYRVRHVMQFHDATAVWPDVPEDVLALWKEYMDKEWMDYGRRVEGLLPQAISRVIPVNVTVRPNTQVLAFDDVNRIVNGARRIAVTRCSCRVIDGKCGKPLEVCIQVNRAADYAIERGTGRQITRVEALEMLRECEEEGLVHIADNRREVGHVICNCCEDCCMNWPHLRAGLKKIVAPSRFAAEVTPGQCTGCELCVEQCCFKAVSMEGQLARVQGEMCMGCGLCAVVCPTDAIALKEKRPPEFVPE
jgi:ferredoxin/DNA-binding MarR family transcriptional regulator